MSFLGGRGVDVVELWKASCIGRCQRLKLERVVQVIKDPFYTKSETVQA